LVQQSKIKAFISASWNPSVKRIKLANSIHKETVFTKSFMN